MAYVREEIGVDRMNEIERLRANSITTESGCFVWQGFLTDKGYGRMTVGSRKDGTYRTGVLVHRVAYESFVGPLDPNLTVDHTCEVKACWNPEHLEQVTNAENKKRGGDRMTHCRRGHERNEENTYVRPDGKRQCRACRRNPRVS